VEGRKTIAVLAELAGKRIKRLLKKGCLRREKNSGGG